LTTPPVEVLVQSRCEALAQCRGKVESYAAPNQGRDYDKGSPPERDLKRWGGRIEESRQQEQQRNQASYQQRETEGLVLRKSQ
jgi:hypothetical protein